MSPTLALIPAKRHSEGRPNKNWEPIEGVFSCVDIAIDVALQSCERVVLTTDVWPIVAAAGSAITVANRPAELCQPTTPMLDVVKHALEAVPGPDDEIIVLLQPTSPLRRVETVKQAIQMLHDDQNATSVVSVTESYPMDWLLLVGYRGYLYSAAGDCPSNELLSTLPSRRQDCAKSYKRDGIVYAFRRSTVANGDIYGPNPLPLHTQPDESLSIDTQADWDEAVRRLAARTSATSR